VERNLDYFVKPKSHKFTQQTQDDIIKMLDSVLNFYNLYICLKAINTPIINLAVISSGIPDTADIVDIYIYSRSNLVV
jgi:hypothetical protein